IVVARVRQNRGMADVAPLKALRYGDQAEPLGELLCPPYDVISPEERDRLYAQNPHNFVRIEFPKPDGDPYAAAAADLAAWRDRAPHRRHQADRRGDGGWRPAPRVGRRRSSRHR